MFHGSMVGVAKTYGVLSEGLTSYQGLLSLYMVGSACAQ